MESLYPCQYTFENRKDKKYHQWLRNTLRSGRNYLKNYKKILHDMNKDSNLYVIGGSPFVLFGNVAHPDWDFVESFDTYLQGSNNQSSRWYLGAGTNLAYCYMANTRQDNTLKDQIAVKQDEDIYFAVQHQHYNGTNYGSSGKAFLNLNDSSVLGGDLSGTSFEVKFNLIYDISGDNNNILMGMTTNVAGSHLNGGILFGNFNENQGYIYSNFENQDIGASGSIGDESINFRRASSTLMEMRYYETYNNEGWKSWWSQTVNASSWLLGWLWANISVHDSSFVANDYSIAGRISDIRILQSGNYTGNNYGDLI